MLEVAIKKRLNMQRTSYSSRATKKDSNVEGRVEERTYLARAKSGECA